MTYMLEPAMPHIEDRIAHDADAHVMEPKDWLDPFVAKSVKSELASLLDSRAAVLALELIPLAPV